MTLVEVLTERSWRHLVEFVNFTLEPMLRGATDNKARERAVDLHLIAFREFESLLKLAVDQRDMDTLRAIDEAWSSTTEDPWSLWEEGPSIPADDWAQVQIARDRVIARVGITMWASHEAAGEEDSEGRDTLLQMVRHVGRHFDTLDHLFVALQWAQEHEDQRQWDNWFLGQLPEGQAHSIPTRQQLLLATLLLALDRLNVETAVQPRDWMRDRWEEIESTLSRIESEPERWAPALGLQVAVASEPSPSATPRRPSISERVKQLQDVLAEGREAAEEAEREGIRRAAPDPNKREELRTLILSGFAEGRVIRPLVNRVASVTELAGLPEGYERRMIRTWLPKELLVPEGRMMGIDFVAKDLARAAFNGEAHELLRALPDGDVESVPDALGMEVRHRIATLREAGQEPSLILIPISWHAREALKLEPVGAHLVEQLGPAAAQALEGVIDGVPVLDTPLVEDRIWIVDLQRAITWDEWPSDDDSGLTFEISFFDEAAAIELLGEHPEIREEGQTDEQVVRDLRTKGLLQLAFCFRVRRGTPDGAVAMDLPPELRRSTSRSSG